MANRSLCLLCRSCIGPALFLIGAIHIATAQTPSISFVPVITGQSGPVDIVNAGDASNRLFVVNLVGVVQVYDQSYNYLADFLDMSGQVSIAGEGGLLSLAFHPSYASNGFFYVYYVNTNKDVEVARFHVSSNPNVADPSSKVILLTIPHPNFVNHYGGKLNFGNDGYLYFATGDGGSGGDPPNNAQNGAVLLGKMLRIAVNTSATPPYYTIPPDNPFVSNPAIADEIWALGLRNPFRWHFDKLTHDIWIGDVGQDAWEEIDFRAAGTTGGINYGWHCFEGNMSYTPGDCSAPSNYVFPVLVYPNPNPGSSAVTGGLVYRGNMYPALQGYYMASDIYSGVLYMLYPDGSGGFIQSSQTGIQNIVGYGEAENGEVYAGDLDGNVYAVTLLIPTPAELISFKGIAGNGLVNLQWKTASENNLAAFDIEYSSNGLGYSRAGTVAALNFSSGASYAFDHRISTDNRIYYRLKIIDQDGKFKYSSVISISPRKTQTGNFVLPSVITGNELQLFLSKPYKSVELFGVDGRLILKRDIGGQTGTVRVPLQNSLRGIYIVTLRTGNNTATQKIIIE
jgi:glucose/arabinose dehydrogenase